MLKQPQTKYRAFAPIALTDRRQVVVDRDGVEMAGQIADFFRSQPDQPPEVGVAGHINDFWGYRMRRGFLALLAALNTRGISESLGANRVATLIEVGGLLLVIVLGAIVIGRGEGDLGRRALATAPKLMKPSFSQKRSASSIPSRCFAMPGPPCTGMPCGLSIAMTESSR